LTRKRRFGSAGTSRGRRKPRKVRRQGGELTQSLGAVGLLDALLELVGGEATFAGVLAKEVDGLVPFEVRSPQIRPLGVCQVGQHGHIFADAA